MKGLVDFLFPPAEPVMREAVAGDVPRLAALHAASFARGWGVDELERLLADRAVRAHVAAPGARRPAVGFVLSHVVPPEAEILSITVAREARGRGIARNLLRHHLARLAGEGITTSFLEVAQDNAAAIGLYRKFGYAQVGRRKGYYGGTDALLLRCDF